MAWSYADYESQTDDTARLARLRLHIAEVSAAIRPDISADGGSQSNAVIQDYLTNVLNERRKELERRVGTIDSADRRARSGITRARLK